MNKQKKVKFSFIFISVLCGSLITLTLILSLLFINSINRFGDYTTNANEKKIHDQAIFLLRKNVSSTAQYYTAIFDGAARNSAIIAKETARFLEYVNFDKAKIEESADKWKSSLTKVNDQLFYNNSEFKDMGLVVLKENFTKQKFKPDFIKKVLYLILEFGKVDENEYKMIPFLHDFWISFLMDKSYTGLFPNTIKGLTQESKWAWGQYSKLMLGYFKKLEWMEKENKRIYWSSIHLSMKKEPLITVMVPIKSRDYGVIGGVGTTLSINEVFSSIVSAPVTPNYGFGIIKDKSKLGILSKSFSFIINNKKEIIAISDEAASVLGLKKISGSSGSYCRILLDENRNIAVGSLLEVMAKSKKGALTLNIEGHPYIFAFSKMLTNWSLCTVVSEYDLLSSVRYSNDLVDSAKSRIIFYIILITVVIVLISIMFGVLFFRSILIRPIINLCHKVKKIGKGNFDITFEEKGTAEISGLSATFSYLCGELSAYEDNLKKEISQKKRIQTEIKIAADIQNSTLPKINEKFQHDDFSIAAKLTAAKEASGDFYDVFELNENKIAILIADVSGKGIVAAFFMAIAKFMIKSLFLQFNRIKPSEVLYAANNLLNKDNARNMFVTVFLGIYDFKKNNFEYSNAGHHSAILIKKDGECREFGEGRSMALGILQDNEYTDSSIMLDAEDTIVLYTDGVHEAVNLRDEEYGLERLKKLLNKIYREKCDKIAITIMDDVKSFEEGNRFDDITLVVFRKEK